MVRHTLQVLGPKVLASRMVQDYTQRYYLPAACALRQSIEPGDVAAGDYGMPFGAARELADYRQKVQKAWPSVHIVEVDSYGLPDTPLLGSELTLTARVCLEGLAPDEVTVQAVLGRVDTGDALVDPVTVPMTHSGVSDGGEDIFTASTPLPVTGPVGYTVRVLPHHRLLAGDNELGLVTLAG